MYVFTDNYVNVYRSVYRSLQSITVIIIIIFITFLVESNFKMDPNMEVMLAFMWSMRVMMSLPYTDSNQRLVGMSMCFGGSWQDTGKRLGRSTNSAHSPA